jgi:uncharacterized protein YerC
MTNISKVNANNNDYKLYYNELSQFIGQLKDKNARHFIDELLTETETIMIVKRFAAIIMIHRNYSPYRVCHTLSISLSTAQRLLENYDNGNYNKLLSCLKEKEVNGFISLIEDLILFQVSSRARARLLNRVL